MTELTNLLLGGNQFTGTLPDELNNLHILMGLCDLNGTIISSTDNACQDRINNRGDWCTHYGSKINMARCGGIDACHPATHLECTDTLTWVYTLLVDEML